VHCSACAFDDASQHITMSLVTFCSCLLCFGALLLIFSWEACGELCLDNASLHVTMSLVTRVSTAVFYDDLACFGPWLLICSWVPCCHSLCITLCTGVSSGLPSAVALMDITESLQSSTQLTALRTCVISSILFTQSAQQLDGRKVQQVLHLKLTFKVNAEDCHS